jgi:hypothetical protein
MNRNRPKGAKSRSFMPLLNGLKGVELRIKKRLNSQLKMRLKS